jgi:hypothetical protein
VLSLPWFNRGAGGIPKTRGDKRHPEEVFDHKKGV